MQNLIQRLEEACSHLNKQDNRKVLPKVLECMKSRERGQLIGPLVKLLPSHDVLIKKVVYRCLVRLCDAEPETSYLLANTALRDGKDPNPLVRSMAIDCLCRLPLLAEYATQALTAGLKDASAYVRRMAVTSVAQLQGHADVTQFVDTLYGMIRDPDPIVAAHCLQALDVILEREGGVVVNRAMVLYLLDRGESFAPLHMVTVFSALKKYIPSNEEEALSLINALDPYLRHESIAVTFAATKVFRKYAHGLNLEVELAKCVAPNTSQAVRESPEATYHLAGFLIKSSDIWTSQFHSEYRLFTPKVTDPVAIRGRKLALLPRLCTERNAYAVLTDICDCGRGVNAADAVRAVCDVGQRVPAVLETCVDKLIYLAELHTADNVTLEVLAAFQTFDLQSLDELKLASTLDFIVQRSSALGAKLPPSLPWLLSNYGENFQGAPYAMETILDSFETYSYVTQDAILSSVAHLFFKRPAESQDLLGNVLEKCAHGENIFLRNKGMMYYRILEKDVNLLKSIVSG